MQAGPGKNSKSQAVEQAQPEKKEIVTESIRDDGRTDGPPNPSLGSRIADSASLLARDVFSTSTSAGAKATTGSLASLASSSKASGSHGLGAPSGPLAPSSSLWENADTRSGKGMSTTSSAETNALNNGFREAQPGQWDQGDASSFQEGRREELMSETYAVPQSIASIEAMSWSAQFREQADGLSSGDGGSKGKGRLVSGDVEAAMAADGLEVANLLNGADSMEDAAFPRLSEAGSTAASARRELPSADELFGQPLSASEAAIKEQILASLPPPPTYRGIGPDSQNNFRPDLEMLHSLSGVSTGAEAQNASQSHTQLSSVEQQREWMRRWMEEWDGVLHRYTDEVWGSELPAVEEAKRQIQEMKTDQGRLDDVQALQRLKMILGHIQVPAPG